MHEFSASKDEMIAVYVDITQTPNCLLIKANPKENWESVGKSWRFSANKGRTTSTEVTSHSSRVLYIGTLEKEDDGDDRHSKNGIATLKK